MIATNVIKIGKTSSTITTKLPTPTTLTPQWQSLDSENTGRDNNIGSMFRDKITDKRKWNVELPSGMTNTEVAEILDIISASDYWIKTIDSLSGTYKSFNVYTSSCEPEVELITELDSNDEPIAWKYKAIKFDVIEM